jgi:hypothetical protein
MASGGGSAIVLAAFIKGSYLTLSARKQMLKSAQNLKYGTECCIEVKSLFGLLIVNKLVIC